MEPDNYKSPNNYNRNRTGQKNSRKRREFGDLKHTNF